MARITVLGECMVELSPEGEGLHRMGFAGDTFNTAVYLARQGDAVLAYPCAPKQLPLG